MRRALIIAALFCASLSFASPLLQLARPVLSPSRMSQGRGSFMLPHLYTQGGEKGFTICWWVRWECPEYSNDDSGTWNALFFQAMNSTVPAKPTTIGGAPLAAFYEGDITLDASGAWGLADIIPAEPPCFPTDNMANRYVVCCNISNATDITLTVGGSEKFLAATNGTHIFNLECTKGDRSIAITGAQPAAKIKVGFAINPPIQFRTLVHYQPDHLWRIPATNVYTFVSLRAELRGGYQHAQFDIFDFTGRHDSMAMKPEKVDITAYPKDCLIQINQMTVFGKLTEAMDGSPRRVDVYGLKALNAYLTDDQLWRIYDCDRAEIIRRKLDYALPPRR